MENYKTDSKKCFKMLDIEKQVTKEKIGEKDINLLLELADEGTPRAYFILGKIELIQNNNEAKAMEWFDLVLQKGNQFVLFSAANFFASYDDLYIDQAMKFLRRAAWRQHPIAKRMLKFMKEYPFKLPEA